jgi:hypothetical protein
MLVPASAQALDVGDPQPPAPTPYVTQDSHASDLSDPRGRPAMGFEAGRPAQSWTDRERSRKAGTMRFTMAMTKRSVGMT